MFLASRYTAAVARRVLIRHVSPAVRLQAPQGVARWFSAEGLALERPAARSRTQRRKRGSYAWAFPGVGGLGIAAYSLSEDFRDQVHEICRGAEEAFEDFNDSSREFFESIGDKIVARRAEPWLLDLATMKFPEYIPTLVLDLDKVILHLEHDSKQGWHVIKRPFADQFFREIQMYYEVVIFSDDVFPVALDIITKWNVPVTGVLHRDFCKKKRSHYVKDLSKLGRKLDKVLMIDHDPAAYQLQPENGIQIKPFEGDPNDSELMLLLDFLKAAASSNEPLPRFVDKFGGGDVDIGRRYLQHKSIQDERVAQRRSVGRAFSAANRNAFPTGPGQKMSSSFR